MTARRALLGLALLTLGLDVFLVHGARVSHPVTVVAAGRMFAARPDFAGIPGFAGLPAGPRPAAGVYRYATVGTTSLDRLGVLRRYPRTTARIVRHGPGCQWSESVPILREHKEAYTACSTSGDQLETGFATELTYFTVPGVGDARCTSPATRTGAGRRSGEVVRVECADRRSGTTTSGTATYVGAASATVDGRVRPCRRVDLLTVFTGRTEGVALRELCTDAVTGLVLVERRSVGISVPSAFVGRVRYVEEAEFRLLSAIPDQSGTT